MSEELSLPYVKLLDGRDPLSVLRGTPVALDALLARIPRFCWGHAPAPGKWSLREILCHLADCEIAWAWRFRHVFEGTQPVLQPFDQDRWAVAYKGAGFTAEAALACWRGLRAFNVAFLETLTEADLEKRAAHPEGNRTLRQLVSIAAGHDLHHLEALEKLANMGQ